MNIKNIQNTFSHILKQRNFSYVVVGVLGLSNLGLTYKVMTTHEMWTLIPMNETHKRLTVSRAAFSDSYLMEWADALTARLLTMNPKTVDLRVHEFLSVCESSNALEQKLKAQADKIKSENISTAFYPQEFHHNKDTQQVWVSGQFHTFFGEDRKPVPGKRAVVLTYRKGPMGVILVQDFNYEDTHASH